MTLGFYGIAGQGTCAPLCSFPAFHKVCTLSQSIYSDPHHFGMHVGYAEDSQEARRIFDGQIAYRKGFKAAKPEEWDVVYEQQWRELEDVHRHGVVQFTVTVAGDHFLPSIGISDVLMLGV